MLVLRREVNEAIVMRTRDGQEIRIVVVDFRNWGDQDKRKVALGFEAPNDVNIVREELLETEA